MPNVLAKLDKATAMLAEAKTLDEVKHIVDIAEAARTYARAAKLGIEASNHAAEVKLRAERKAGELLARLERKPEGRPAKLFQGGTVSEYREVLDEQEIPTTTAHRWQTIATIPEKTFERHIAEVVKSKGELTTAGLLRANSNTHVSDDSYEWYTPEEYIEAARRVMGSIDLDPASCKTAQETIKAKKYFTKENDGLIPLWGGNVWLNPPYSMPEVELFTGKAVQHFQEGRVTQAVILTNNATDTQWFHILAQYPFCLTSGRIHFWNDKGVGLQTRQGQAFFYLGGNVQGFVKEFSQFGIVVGKL